MKKQYFLILFCLIAMLSCGDGNTPEEQKEVLELKEQSIAEGAEVDANTITVLTLRYNKMVRIAANASITLNGAALQATCSAMEVSIPLQLVSATDYTLRIAAGSIVSVLDSTIVSGELNLHFKTAAQKEQAICTELSDKNAIPQAQNVFAFLLEQYGKRTISAAMANVSWNISEADLVYAATGKYPAMATMDYIHMLTQTTHSPYNGWVVNYADISVLETWWNNNGLLAASWHWNVPRTEADITNTEGYTCTPGNGTTGTTFKPSNVMKEGTWEKRIADEDLAVMADNLLLLQEKNIPLLFRPYHEASGNTYSEWNLVNGKPKGNAAWFWWGAEGAEVYKELWKYTYEYFQSKGIHNLIWVWTSQNNGDTDWYPGDAYVDIIGQDIYNQGSMQNVADFMKLQATYPNKMIALSECGNVGLISEQWTNGARWSWFMPWYQYNATTLDGHEHANTAWWQDAMTYPNVITRDQMPSLK